MKRAMMCKYDGKAFSIKIWWIMAMLLVSIESFGQVTYRVGLDADKITYRIFMKSAVSYSGIQAKISTAQVTLVVPHGIGANQFIASNVIGKIAGSNQMSWGISRADIPTENPTSDYISFGFSGSGSAVLFDIVAGQEIELFRFQNSGNCLGTVNLITDSDPFLPPNSNNSNPGNQITILGYGQSNAYAGNYGGGVSCQSTFPDLTVAITGASNITAGTAINYSIAVNNVGTAVSSGQISVATTLPNGVSYNSFTGAGWTVNAAPQGNGTTIVTATNNSSLAINGSLNTLQLNVTAAASIGNGNLISLSSIVSGGGESNLANNISSMSSTVAVNSPNLALTMSGPSNISPNNSANYTLNLANVGLAASSGQITTSLTLPNGLTYNSFIGTGWSYVSSTLQTGGAMLLTFTYNNAINANGSASALVVNVTSGSNLTNNAILTINGSVSGGGDNTPANNTASVNTTVVVAPAPNLNVVISGSNSIVAGTNTNYTFTINNTGSGSTTGQITNTLTLPSGVVYNSFVGSGWNVVANPQANGTTLITATYNGSIVAGGSANQLVLNVTPQQSIAGNNVTINSVVSGGGNATNASGNINISVVSAPSLSMTVSGNTNITAGSTGIYTFNISNNSTSATSGQVTNTITLPAGVSYNSFTGDGWNFVSSSPQANGTTILVFTNNNAIVTLSSLALNLSFASNLANNSSLIINVVVSGGGSQNATENIMVTIIAASNPDLTLNLNGTTTTTPNGSASYTFNINNIGNVATIGQITASILLPNGLTYSSFIGTGWTYGSSTLQTGGAMLITFTTNNIIAANGLNNNLLVNVLAGNSPNGTVFNITGKVSGGGESVTTNNSSTVTLTIVVQGTPQITATIVGLSTITPNIPYSYTINVNNIGNIATTGNVTTSTVLPVGIVYNSTSGTNWSSTATIQPNGTTLVVSTYTAVIAANGSATPLILNVTPSGTLASGSVIIINGSVTGGGASNTGNNTFTINSTVVTSASIADLGVMATLDNKIPNLSQNINYTFTIINNGTGTPTSVQNLIKLPAGFMINSFSSSSGTFNQSTGIWTIGSIAVGQTFSLIIIGKPTVESIDFASIQLTNSNLQDNVSSNNLAKVCYATPVSLCTGEGYIAYLDKQATNVKWFKNSTQINLATKDSLLITTAGSYSASYTNSCGTIVNTPNIIITVGAAPTPPTITANKIIICDTELAQLTASNCNEKITWNTGATTTSINVNAAGTYAATCTNACGISQSSTPIVITKNCGTIGSIGDFVWYDNNNNGKQDAGEAGVKGVILELFKDGVSTGIKDTTDSQGKYLFTNLVSGNYQVKINTSTFPINYLLSQKSNEVGVADSLDSDFDFISFFSPTVVINTKVAGQSSNLTIDGGIRFKPAPTIEDPCKCFGVEYDLDEKKELYETVTVKSSTGEVWKVIQQTGMLALDSLIKHPVLIGTQLTEVSAGKYQINFTHEDNVGYTLKVSNGTDTLMISNFCSIYPKVQITKLDKTICRNSPPIPLTFSMPVPGTANYYYIDKITNQKVIITSFDPKIFTAGETIYIKIDIVPTSGLMCAYIITQTLQLSVTDCNLNCVPKVCVPISVQKTK